MNTSTIIAALIGAVVGFATGRLTSPRALEVTVPAHPLRRLFGGRLDLTSALLVFAAIAMLVSVIYVVTTRAPQDALDRSVACQARYNDAYAKADEARTDASIVKDRARDRVIAEASRTLVNPGTQRDLPALRRAVTDYNEATEALDEARERNPYPAFPKTCDGRMP